LIIYPNIKPNQILATFFCFDTTIIDANGGQKINHKNINFKYHSNTTQDQFANKYRQKFKKSKNNRQNISWILQIKQA